MKRVLAAVALLGAASRAQAADPAHPMVVELFQSQGCSSCPPANARVIAIAGRPDVLALSWQVTYWDYLGWKDSFAQPAFTSRQYDYARRLGHDQVFTPQVVVNGRVDGVGAAEGELRSMMALADRGDSGTTLDLGADAVHVGGGATGAHGDVVLVRYDPNLVQVPVRRGENAGETLPHRDVVRQVRNLGAWNGTPADYALPPSPRPGLKTAVLVQDGPGGAILAAARN